MWPDYRTLTIWSLGCGVVMAVVIRLQVRRVLKFNPELAPDAPRVCRSIELLFLEAVLFNAMMAYVVGCSSPFPFQAPGGATPCVVLPTIAHTLVAAQILWWAWRTDGPELVIKFEELGPFTPPGSPSEVRWSATLAAIGSLAAHLCARVMGV
jgi:hypothetical protein